MFVLKPRGEHFAIVHENYCFAVGHVYKDDGRYQVTRCDVPDYIDITTVTSLDEAIQAFAAHYEQHPPKWFATNERGWAIERPATSEAPCYTKIHAFGGLDVKRDQQGAWIACRGDSRPLLRDGKPARFATREEAQRIADLHGDDSYVNSVPINDGYSWQVDPNVKEYLRDHGRARTSNSAAAAA
jgi:hypothetical protein